MHRQGLSGAPYETPAEVVGAFGAMQAQEFVPAKWALAQRAAGVDETTVDEAFAAGRILRTHVVRPTWHFVRPEDLGWLLDLTGPRVDLLNAYYYRKFELDPAVFTRCASVFRSVLAGRHLTRKALAGELSRAGVEASGLRLGYILMRAELDRVLVSGALDGRQQTYALYDERVPSSPAVDRDEALAELARRYFATRGPATVKDFSTWSSLTVADARHGVDLVGASSEDVDGRTYWFLDGPAVASPPGVVVDLVQGYDEYVMSYSESKDVLLGTTADAAAYLHATLLGGRLVGHWKHTVARRTVTVSIALHRALGTDERKALDAAVERFGRFLGLPATCSVNGEGATR